MDDNCPNFMDNGNDGMMDGFLLFVMPPLFGFGIYYIMRNDGKFDDFIQSMIGYVKRIGEKKDE